MISSQSSSFLADLKQLEGVLIEAEEAVNSNSEINKDLINQLQLIQSATEEQVDEMSDNMD